MDNPHRERILEFMKNSGCFDMSMVIQRNYCKYVKHANSDNIDELYKYENMTKYNCIICLSIRNYIYFLKVKPFYIDEVIMSKLKAYESEFLKLFKNILTTNYLNIKHDLTLNLLSSYDCNITIKYLKDNNLSYLLARINPEKIYFINNEHKEYVLNLYYEQTSLKLTWFSALIKSAYFGPP